MDLDLVAVVVDRVDWEVTWCYDCVDSWFLMNESD